MELSLDRAVKCASPVRCAFLGSDKIPWFKASFTSLLLPAITSTRMPVIACELNEAVKLAFLPLNSPLSLGVGECDSSSGLVGGVENTGFGFVVLGWESG